MLKVIYKYQSSSSRDVTNIMITDNMIQNFGPNESLSFENIAVMTGDYNAWQIDAKKEFEYTLLNPQHWPEGIYPKIQTFRNQRQLNQLHRTQRGWRR